MNLRNIKIEKKKYFNTTTILHITEWLPYKIS